MPPLIDPKEMITRLLIERGLGAGTNGIASTNSYSTNNRGWADQNSQRRIDAAQNNLRAAYANGMPDTIGGGINALGAAAAARMARQSAFPVAPGGQQQPMQFGGLFGSLFRPRGGGLY